MLVYDANIIELLKKQCQLELKAYSMYHVFSYWFLNKGLINFSKLFRHNRDEEIEHFDKFYDLLNQYTPIYMFPAVENVNIDVNSGDVLTILNSIYELELLVTKSIINIANIAKTINDEITFFFLQDFIKEQQKTLYDFRQLIFAVQQNYDIYDIDMNLKSYINF